MNTRRNQFLSVGLCLVVALSACGGGYGGGDSNSNQITSLSITPTDSTITSDGMQQYTVTATNSGGGTVPGIQLAWHTSQAGVATIDSDGLATAVAAGTTTITATRDTSIDYSGGGIVTSNEATLTVTSASSVMGLAVSSAPIGNAPIGAPIRNAPIGNALLVLRDRDGVSQTTLTDAAGRFDVSVAGMSPPFVLQVSDQNGNSLFSAAVQPGVANVNPVTDLLVRAWFRANSMNADAAFSGRQPPGGPDAGALESLSGGVEKAFSQALSGQGVTPHDFSFFTTPFALGDAGLDRALAGLRTSVSSARMAIHDEVSGRNAEVIFASPGSAALRISSGMGRSTDIPLLP